MRKKGFTLIELLVVIAIIALLLSILLPSLKTVKKLAQGVVCTTRVRQLSLGWFLYNGDNNGNLMGAHTDKVTVGSGEIPPWARGMDENLLQPGQGTIDDQIASDKERLREGALWPYVEEEKVYHCPGDRVVKLGQGSTSPYRSFAVPRSMNGGRDTIGGVKRLASWQASKGSHIKTPSEKIVFLSEFDVWILNGDFNGGEWVMDCGNPGNFWDPIAVWHNDSGTMGFADGHAELHKWKDPETLEMAEVFRIGSVPDPANNVDVQFLKRAYRATGRY